MPSDLPDLEVEDVQEEFDSFEKTMSSLNDHLVGIGIDHMNKITLSLSENDILRLRDSIMQRLKALRVHLVLFLRLQNEHVAKIQEAEGQAPALMSVWAEEQFSVFDSLVFHSCSLFDYLGYMISYLCDEENMKKRSWNNITSAFHDPNNELSDCFASSVVLDHHRDWVQKLFDYRADLIHYKADGGGATTSWDLMTNERTITVYAPQRFVSAMSELRKQSDDYNITLRYVAFWISQRTVNAAHDIIMDLRELIERRSDTPEGDRPIKWDAESEDNDST